MESRCSQIEFKEGLFELNQDTLKELADSKYMNHDLIPTSATERTWNTYNIGMLWVGMVICITGFSYAAALIALGMGPIPALINVAMGNLIVLIPMQMNSHAGTRYGIPFPVFARIAFGRVGAHIPSVLRAVVAAGWCAVQCWVGGAAFSSIIGLFSSNWDTEGAGRFIGFGLFLILTLIVGIKGAEGIKWLESLGSPILIILCIAMVFWIVSLGNEYGVSVADMFLRGSDPVKLAANGGYLYVFLAGITSNIAVWATLALNIPDFSRYAKSQKVQFRGQLYAMPISVIVLATVGAMFAVVTEVAFGKAEFDPTAVLLHLDNKIVIFIVSIGIIIATLTTNMAANVVAPANGFANLAPKKVSFRVGIIITCALCILYRPWWMYGDAGAFMFTWLGTCGTILAPVAAILVADYFVIKKKRVNVRALYDEGDDTYTYNNGWNVRAIVAWVLAFSVPLLGQFGIGGAVTMWINANSYIIGFIIAFILYILLMKSEKKSYVSEEQFSELTDKKYAQ